jgi:high-affinity Fe2+/Pb2+ permease
MPKPKSQSTLQEVVNLPEEVKAFGRTYQIREFSLGQLAQAVEHVGIIGFLIKKFQEFPVKDGKIVASQSEIIDILTIALASSGPALMGLVSIATREPTEWLEEQRAMDGVKIFAKVVEKNLDFFSQSSINEFKEIFDGLSQSVLKLGGDSSTT